MSDSLPSSRPSSREVKRERILRAAVEVFANKGYFAARMTDVAKSAEVADGTLYLYFEGKEHLLLSIFDDVLGRFIDQLEHEVAALDDPVEKLRVMVRLHLETLGGDRDLAHVLQIETRHSRRFMSVFTRGKLGEYLSLLRGIIEEGQRTGAFRRDISSGLATNVVFGAVDELVMSWILADDPGDLSRYADPILEILMRGVMA
ncbi:MAG: TetR family transcriptional regulator [Thermoanaerobaculales bacterium]|jgi:TetR/AcrR family fatty acid metabolism transcriptional regulator|nr:TetR family transcriptional regulator [Thermoanaerobaculales bacterium]